MALVIDGNHEAREWNFNKPDFREDEKYILAKINYRLEDEIRSRVGKLEMEIKILKEELEKNICLDISDEEAENEIKKYIIKQKCLGINRLNILDMMEYLRLPPEQINKIMRKLAPQGIREVE